MVYTDWRHVEPPARETIRASCGVIHNGVLIKVWNTEWINVFLRHTSLSLRERRNAHGSCLSKAQEARYPRTRVTPELRTAICTGKGLRLTVVTLGDNQVKKIKIG